MRLLKSVGLSRDASQVVHGYGVVALKHLLPGDRFFDVTALYVDANMGPRHAPDAAKQALAAAKSGVPPGERYLPISPTVYYELKRGQFHALSYFFNEDRREESGQEKGDSTSLQRGCSRNDSKRKASTL